MTDYTDVPFFEKFKREFGIHFKDSPSELELVEGFLEEVYYEGKHSAYEVVADGKNRKTQNLPEKVTRK